MLIFGNTVPAILFIDLAFALVMLAVGVAAGWLLSPRGARSLAEEKADHAIARLRELASNMAADVGQHKTRMQAINYELHEAQGLGQGGSIDLAVAQAVENIVRANEALQEQLSTAEVRLQRQEEELKNQLAAARTDALTGISNRRAFDDELNRRLAEWQRRKTIFSLVMLDVDFFKKFNDTYGHQAGDEVLKGVAGKLKQTMRDMDFVARYGGEEFAAVLPVTNRREALIAAERIRTAIEQAVFRHEGTELRVTCSMGVAQVEGDDTLAAIVKRADQALYESKSAGRNCIHYHEGDSYRKAEFAAEMAPPPISPHENTPLPPGEIRKPDSAVDEAELSDHESGFHADLTRRVAEARRFHVPLTLLMLEIDRFEELGERVGTTTSDLIYDTMSDFIRVVMQEMDVASRRGNGQFAIMMPGTDLDCAAAVAERLRAAVEGYTLQIQGIELRLTLSAGLSETIEHDNSSTLTKRAAAALFAARKNGRNCTYLHNGETCVPAALAVPV